LVELRPEDLETLLPVVLSPGFPAKVGGVRRTLEKPIRVERTRNSLNVGIRFANIT
jgi:hypothetical protein